MNVRLLQAAKLDRSLIARWKSLQRAGGLDNPYFCPEFTQCVADVRDDVEVAVMEDAGEIQGFWPFQRTGSRMGKPVGGRLSDFQAIIRAPQQIFDPAELVHKCKLNCFDFDHLVVQQEEFRPFWYMTDGSPYLDLTDGFEGYLQRRKQLGDNEVKSTLRKVRKVERELGPLRLVFSTTDRDVLEFVVKWKSDQYRRTKITDVFAFPWTVQLLERLLQEDQPDFRGVLSALYAGENLIAAHMGMRTQHVLHYWFPTYDPRFSHVSPGRILLLQLTQACPSAGITRIDLGRGVSDFKRRAMTDLAEVAVGSVDLRPVHRRLRAGWRHTKDWVRNSPLRTPARVPARLVYHVREWLEFQ